MWKWVDRLAGRGIIALMDRKYLQDVAEFNVRRTWNTFAKVFPELKNHNVPAVKINNRLKTTAGKAWYDLHLVEFSAELMWEHTDNFIADTIPHEVAHLVAAIVFGDFGHRSGWKQTLEMGGFTSNRCHNMINSKHEARKAKVI